MDASSCMLALLHRPCLSNLAFPYVNCSSLSPLSDPSSHTPFSLTTTCRDPPGVTAADGAAKEAPNSRPFRERRKSIRFSPDEAARGPKLLQLQPSPLPVAQGGVGRWAPQRVCWACIP